MLAIIFCIAIYVIYIEQVRQQMTGKYNAGIYEINSGNYQTGIDILSTLGDYKDSIDWIDYAQKGLIYKDAVNLFDNQEYELAEDKFRQLGEFLDSESYADSAFKLAEEKRLKEKEEELKEEETRLREECYESAYAFYQEGKYKKALELFDGLSGYNDAEEMSSKCKIALKRLAFSNSISAGIRFSASVTQDGKVFFSGRDFIYEDELYTWNNIVSVSVEGHFVMGLKNDGTVVTAGQIGDKDDDEGKYYIDTSDWHDIVSVSAGQLYIVGLRANGTLTAQGYNGDGQANIREWTDIVAVDTSWRTTVGLDSDGNIHITGYGSKRQLQQIEDMRDEWTDIVAISTGGGSNIGGGGHTVGLRRDGTVVAVGANENNQCNVSGWKDIVAISAGDDHTVGLRNDGTVITTLTGTIINGWEDIVAVSAGYGFTLGLKEDGTVLAIGNDADGQSNVGNWSNVAIREEWELISQKDCDYLFTID